MISYCEKKGPIKLVEVISLNHTRLPGCDTEQSSGGVPVVPGLWGVWSAPSLPLLRVRSCPAWWHLVGPCVGLNGTNGILILNWTVWLNWMAWSGGVFDSWTVFTFELHAHTKLKQYLHLNCILMLNWIIWNGTVFDRETISTLNWIV